MTNEQLIAKFNPEHGATLSAEDLETLHTLTDDQIDILADAYPNKPVRRSYLRLYDKKLAPEKQLYQLSTWENLRAVRKFSNQKNLIPWDFFTSATRNTNRTPPRIQSVAAAAKGRVVVDLSAQEAADELRNLVDKNQNGTQKKTTAKKAKATPSAKKADAGNVTTPPAPVVDNVGTPADQQFTDGEPL